MSISSSAPCPQPRVSLLAAAFVGVALLASLPAYSQMAGQMPEVPAFLPGVDVVPATQAMPLDGTYIVSSIRKKIRIEAGRAYAVDSWLHLFLLKVQPGMVVIKNITPTAAGEYVGDDLPLGGKWKGVVQADRTIAVQVAGALGPARYVLTPIQLDNPSWYAQEMAAAGLAPQQPVAPTTAPVYQPAPPPQSASYTPPPAPQQAQPLAPPVQVSPSAVYAPAPPRAAASTQNNPISASDGTDRMAATATRSHSNHDSKRKEKPSPVQAPPGRGQEAPTRVEATLIGPAEKWGCKGENLYFTPHDGGQCWSCPRDYRRMASVAIWKSRSCEKRGLSLERVDARFVRSAYGCKKGQFNRKNECYVCPAGTTLVSYAGINPEKACQVN